MVKDLKKFYDRYKTAIQLALVGLVLYQFRSFFANASAVVTAPLGAMAEKAKMSAEDAHDKQVIAAVSPKATTSDVYTFKEDARALAAAFGYLPGSWSNTLLADRPGAFAILKKYTKVIMRSGKPHIVDGKVQKRKTSLQLPVLYGLYKEITNGRSLRTDCDKFFDWDDEMGRIWRNYIRP